MLKSRDLHTIFSVFFRMQMSLINRVSKNHEKIRKRFSPKSKNDFLQNRNKIVKKIRNDFLINQKTIFFKIGKKSRKNHKTIFFKIGKRFPPKSENDFLQNQEH